MLKAGRLEIITGCMFSGKSEELQRRARRALIAKGNVKLFKPSTDDRYDKTKITSHSGQEISAIGISSNVPELIYSYLNEANSASGIYVIAIDEIQFFHEKIVDLLKVFVVAGIRVIVAGLDTDYRRIPWEPVPTLMALANNVQKLHAICTFEDANGFICGEEANCTQRITGGTERVVIGGKDKYEARCLDHHHIP